MQSFQHLHFTRWVRKLVSDVWKQTQFATKGRHFSQHTCLPHFLWEQPLALAVASVVPQEGTEEAPVGIPKTPLTLSLSLSLPGNQAGGNMEVYNHREKLREELPWAKWLIENKAQVVLCSMLLFNGAGGAKCKQTAVSGRNSLVQNWQRLEKRLRVVWRVSMACPLPWPATTTQPHKSHSFAPSWL